MHCPGSGKWHSGWRSRGQIWRRWVLASVRWRALLFMLFTCSNTWWISGRLGRWRPRGTWNIGGIMDGRNQAAEKLDNIADAYSRRGLTTPARLPGFLQTRCCPRRRAWWRQAGEYSGFGILFRQETETLASGRPSPPWAVRYPHRNGSIELDLSVLVPRTTLHEL